MKEVCFDIYFNTSAVMDGIDLDIEGGSYKYYPEFITELRILMDKDSLKSYLITGAPQCPYPDHYLGPKTSGSGEIKVCAKYHLDEFKNSIHRNLEQKLE